MDGTIIDRIWVHSSMQVLDTAHNRWLLYHHNIIMQMTENVLHKIGISGMLTQGSKEFFFSWPWTWNEVFPQEVLAYLRGKSKWKTNRHPQTLKCVHCWWTSQYLQISVNRAKKYTTYTKLLCEGFFFLILKIKYNLIPNLVFQPWQFLQVNEV